MASDLGVKALVEFEATGQGEVLAAADRMRAGLGRIGGALGAAGIAVGIQQVVGYLQDAGRAVEAWAAQFEQASLAAEISTMRIRGRLKELASEGERVRIGTDIQAQLSRLRSELGQVMFDERQEELNPWKRLRAGLEDYIAGFDTGAAKVAQLRQQIFDLQKLAERTATQKIAAELVPVDFAGLNEALTRSQRDLDLGDALRAKEAAPEGGLERAAITDSIITHLREEEAKLMEARQALVADLGKAVEAGLAKDADAIAKRIVESTRELNSLRDQVAGLSAELNPEQKLGKVQEPRPELRVDRLTRIGATLGDPGLAGPSRRDPTYFQEQANVILREIRDAMRDNRRANYGSPAAYED